MRSLPRCENTQIKEINEPLLIGFLSGKKRDTSLPRRVDSGRAGGARVERETQTQFEVCIRSSSTSLALYEVYESESRLVNSISIANIPCVLLPRHSRLERQMRSCAKYRRNARPQFFLLLSRIKHIRSRAGSL